MAHPRFSRRVLSAAAAVLALTASAVSPAFAGPVEDGVKAYMLADYPTALKLLTPEAEKGDPDAQYTLGQMYLKGQGVPEDKIQAHVWLDLSARSGDADTIAERNQMEADMTPDQLAEAKRRVADWKPKQ